MIPHIPKQRQVKNPTQPFNDLVSYIEARNEVEPIQRMTGLFGAILEYATSPTDGLTSEDKCIGIRTHGISDISTAGIEMNAVAEKNRRCDSPAYHFIRLYSD